MSPKRDKNGKFLPKAEEPADPILERHHANLKSLGTELAALGHLSDLWRDLATELGKEEALVESTVDDILAGEATDSELGAKSVRVASLQAQIGALRKRANVTGTALQTRLQKDIEAVEWLARNCSPKTRRKEPTRLRVRALRTGAQTNAGPKKERAKSRLTSSLPTANWRAAWPTPLPRLATWKPICLR